MIVSDVQEKQKLLLQPISTVGIQEFENAFKMPPITNAD